jgi:hypothetical protein
VSPTKHYRLGKATTLGLFAAAGLLFYELFTGQSR